MWTSQGPRSRVRVCLGPWFYPLALLQSLCTDPSLFLLLPSSHAESQDASSTLFLFLGVAWTRSWKTADTLAGVALNLETQRRGSRRPRSLDGLSQPTLSPGRSLSRPRPCSVCSKCSSSKPFARFVPPLRGHCEEGHCLPRPPSRCSCPRSRNTRRPERAETTPHSLASSLSPGGRQSLQPCPLQAAPSSFFLSRRGSKRLQCGALALALFSARALPRFSLEEGGE